MLAGAMHVLTAGTCPRTPDDDPTPHARWAELVAALRARGDTVTVLTTVAPGVGTDEDAGVLRWFWGSDGWRRPARLEASRIARHALRLLGDELQRAPADVVVWTAMAGLPLTLVGATGRPELALVLDDWPVLGPQVDPTTRRDGWDPGAVALWSCADEALAQATRAVLPEGHGDRVAVDPADDGTAWTSAVLARLDALAAGAPR
jgi:hypothetical protein